MSKRKKILLRWGIFLACILLLAGIELLYSNYRITVSRYTLSSEKVIDSFRIVFLTDLHGRELGTNNQHLLEKIEAEQPDLICMGGDIFNSTADEAEVTAMCCLIHGATAIAPVYFGLGNHETAYIRQNGSELLERIAEAGAVVLHDQYLDLEIKGTPLRIGGYAGYYRTPHMNTGNLKEQKRLLAFASAFEDTERYKLLLNHVPTNWLDWNYRDRYPVDLILSGHYHGGLVRIPLLEQGLYAPYVGVFPPYTQGLFEGTQASCILSTGFAGHRIPRIFNPPELVVVDIE